MNNLTPRKIVPDHILYRKFELFSLLDEICTELEIPPAQREEAKKSYEAVSTWLSESSNPILKYLNLYAHGSMVLGTTVMPLGREDFDVDVICLVLGFSSQHDPAELKRFIGGRLRENARYAAMLEEKKRCWRLNYAREFHLDVSPTVLNPQCTNGGELVPDKKLKSWKATNPTGYRLLFESRAELQPKIRFQKAAAAGPRADVAPFPAHSNNKGILRTIVQLLKRHRDIDFAEVKEDIAPISIIITTLAMRSYEFCIQNFGFDTELDVLVDTIRMMPHFIEHPVVNGRQIYLISNESTNGENFADRWNVEPQRARAFYRWHQKALSDFESLTTLEGADLIAAKLEKSLGSKVVRRVIDARTDAVTTARSAKQLYVAPAVGLTLSSSAKATPVPGNTFFGDAAE
jgi:hypothetical protein